MARNAPTTHRTARLSEDFGRQLAERWFGAEAIASLPVLKAGPHKGQPKGTLNWLTTTAAGYHVNAGGGVAAGTVVRAWVGEGMSDERNALSGMWMGRVQNLCGSKALLNEEARQRDAAERARDAAELQAALDARDARRAAQAGG